MKRIFERSMSPLCISLATVCVLLSYSANAEIPGDFYRLSPSRCFRQHIQSQNTQGTIRVMDALRCDDFQRALQLIEVEVENYGMEKHFVVDDFLTVGAAPRRVAGHPISDGADMEHTDGAVLYLGQTETGRDRFIISLLSAERPPVAPRLDIYVRMVGHVFGTTAIELR